MEARVAVIACMIAVLVGSTGEVAADAAPGTAALQAQCSTEDWRSLDNTRFYAATAIIEALGEYSFDHPAAQNYFGAQHEGWRVEEILTTMSRIANSSEVSFSCEPESSERCGPNTILAVQSDAWETGDFTVYVCGRRFWSREWLSGEDRDEEASQIGAMVHEIAHLAGAVEEGYGEDFVRSIAETEGGYYSFRYADAYRFYVMRQADF